MADVPDDVSDVLPIVGEDSVESSFMAHKGMKAMSGHYDNSGNDIEETYTSISSTTSSTDKMLDAQLELAMARKAEARADAQIAQLKVAKAVNKAASASTVRSNERSRSGRFEQHVFTPPQGRVDPIIQDDISDIHVVAPMRKTVVPFMVPAEGAQSMEESSGNLEEDLSNIMGESIEKGTTLGVPSLLPRPPAKVEGGDKPIVMIPPLELNAKTLEEFARLHHETERKLQDEAIIYRQEILRDAENSVQRLSLSS